MKCPNCRATLVYNAATNMLECRYCESTFAPDEVDPTSSAEAQAEERVQTGYVEQPDQAAQPGQPGQAAQAAQPAQAAQSGQAAQPGQPTQPGYGQQPASNTVNFTSYICSSCGAELVGTYDTSAIGFCSYCGGESIIASRIAAQRPDRIVPFSRTKESCKEIYMNTVNDLRFVPKELKEERHVDEIRGIYVPYNIYRTHHEGALNLQFTQHDSRYNYCYGLSGGVSSDCAVPIDASVQLDDYIGSTVFPYDVNQEAPFHESYLSTYYVELPDANDAEYMPAVSTKVLDYENDLASRGYKTDSVTDKRDEAYEHVTMTGKDVVLAPLYFLTYRNKDKVCYTVLPGTENDASIYAEIPIDVPKYMIALFGLAAALWAVLSFVPFIPTLPHNAIMLVMGVLSLVALFLHKGEYDKQHKKNDYFGKKNSKGLTIGLSTGFFIACVIIGASGGRVVDLLVGPLFRLVLAALTIFVYVRIVLLKAKDKNIDIRYSHLLFAVSMLMIVLGFVDAMLPVPDEAIYAMMAVAFAASLVGFLGLIKIFNASCERERPHFTRKGGHNAAQDL